jgi:hypothetical protein
MKCPMCSAPTENNELISEFMEQQEEFGKECGLREGQMFSRISQLEEDVFYYKDLAITLGVGLFLIVACSIAMVIMAS